MSILDYNQQYQAIHGDVDGIEEDAGKLFWFSGSMRLNKKKKGKAIVTEDVLSEQTNQIVESKPLGSELEDFNNHSAYHNHPQDFHNAGTYFKLNGSFGDSDLSQSDIGESPEPHLNGEDIDNGEDSAIGTWFGLSGRRRRAESMQNLLDVDKGEPDEPEISNEQLDNLDAQFKAIEQMVLESFDDIDFGLPEHSKEKEKPFGVDVDHQKESSNEKLSNVFNGKSPQNIDTIDQKKQIEQPAEKQNDITAFQHDPVRFDVKPDVGKELHQNVKEVATEHELNRNPKDLPNKQIKKNATTKTKKHEDLLHGKKKSKDSLDTKKTDTEVNNVKHRVIGSTKTESKIQNTSPNELQTKTNQIKNKKQNATNKKSKTLDTDKPTETASKTKHVKKLHHHNRNDPTSNTSAARDKPRTKKAYVRTNSSGIVRSRTEEFEKISKDAPVQDASGNAVPKISKTSNRDKVKSKNPSRKRIDSNETDKKATSETPTVSEDNIEQVQVADNYAMNDLDFEFIDTYLKESEQKQTPALTTSDSRPIPGDLPMQDENDRATLTESRAEPPRALLKRQMLTASSVNSSMDESDFATTDDEDSGGKSLKRGTSFRRSIVIEDDEGPSADRRKKSTGGTCVSVAFMAVNTSANQDGSAKKETNQQLKGVLNFLENMVLDEESVGLYYDAVRILHTIFWDLKDEKKTSQQTSNESLSSVLNFLVVHEWPKVMLSCFKKLKASFPNVFMEEPDAEVMVCLH